MLSLASYLHSTLECTFIGTCFRVESRTEGEENPGNTEGCRGKHIRTVGVAEGMDGAESAVENLHAMSMQSV